MHFVTHTKTMKDAVDTVAQVVISKTTLPVLHCFIIKASMEGFVQVSGTDLETYFSIKFNADVREAGAICVTKETLIHALAGCLPSCNLEVNLDKTGTKCVLNNMYILNGIDYDEAPPLPLTALNEYERSFDSSWSIWSNEIYETIHSTAFARSDDDARPILTGILLGVRDGKIVGTTTDGFRIAHNDTSQIAHPEDVLIYGKAIDVIEKQMKGKETTPVRVIIWKKKNCNSWVTMEWKLTGKQYTGKAMLYISVMPEVTFPDYRVIIPPDLPFRLSMQKNILVNALNGVKHIMTGNKSSHIVHLGLHSDKVIVFANNEEFGQIYTELPAEVNLPEGVPFMLAFNNNYLLEALVNDVKSEVYMRFKYPGTPVMFVFNGDFRYILMPMMNDEHAWPSDMASPEQIKLFYQMILDMEKQDKANREAVQPVA